MAFKKIDQGIGLTDFSLSISEEGSPLKTTDNCQRYLCSYLCSDEIRVWEKVVRSSKLAPVSLHYWSILVRSRFSHTDYSLYVRAKHLTVVHLKEKH